MKIIFGWLAVLAALVSAKLWFWAANIKLSAAEFTEGLPKTQSSNSRARLV
jgi:hypothetical protein